MIMSFKKFLKECGELEALKVEEDKNTQLVDYIKQIEELNNDTFRDFAVNTLGMTEDEADTVVYKMLRDYLLKDEADSALEDELPLDIDAEEIDGDEEVIALDLDAEIDVDEEPLPVDDDEDFDVEVDEEDLED